MSDPRAPGVGPLKPLFVDHKILGQLSGRERERFVNHYLARKLAAQLTNSQSKLSIDAGETVLASHLPPLRLGSPCTNNIILGATDLSAVVTRDSRVRATSGLSLYSHNTPSLDILGHARLHTALTISGGLKAVWMMPCVRGQPASRTASSTFTTLAPSPTTGMLHEVHGLDAASWERGRWRNCQIGWPTQGDG